jgi:hypothetical protein
LHDSASLLQIRQGVGIAPLRRGKGLPRDDRDNNESMFAPVLKEQSR